MRIAGFIEYAALVVGGVGMLASHTFDQPRGFQLSLCVVGTGIVLGGLESIFTGRSGFRWANDSFEDYAGAPAVVWGLMLLTVGCAVIGSAYLIAEGSWGSAVSYLSRRPGPVLAVGGLLLAGTGFLLILTSRGRASVAWMLLIRVPKVLVGFVLLNLGYLGVLLGVWEWLDPRAFGEVAATFGRNYDLDAVGRAWRGGFGLRN
jgi:hypothetical protein